MSCSNRSKLSWSMTWLTSPQSTSVLAPFLTMNLSLGDLPVNLPVSAARAPATVSSPSPFATAASTRAAGGARYTTSMPDSGKPPSSPSSSVPRCRSLTRYLRSERLPPEGDAETDGAPVGGQGRGQVEAHRTAELVGQPDAQLGTRSCQHPGHGEVETARDLE